MNTNRYINKYMSRKGSSACGSSPKTPGFSSVDLRNPRSTHNDSVPWRPRRIRTCRRLTIQRLLLLVMIIIPFGFLAYYTISSSQERLSWFKSPQGTPVRSSSKSPIQARHVALELCSDPEVPQPKPRGVQDLPNTPTQHGWKRVFLDFLGLDGGFSKRHEGHDHGENSDFSYHTRTYTGTGKDYWYSDYYYSTVKPTWSPTPTAHVSRGHSFNSKPTPVGGDGEENSGFSMREQGVPGMGMLLVHIGIVVVAMGFGVGIWG